MNQTAQTDPTGQTGVVQMSDITFGYPASDGGEPHLFFQNLTINIAPGTCTLFCGPSGSGKSTALKMINGLIPQLQPGHMAGTVTVSGHDIDTVDLPNIGHLSATVFQNPRSQFFTTHVLSEIAYAGENYQVPVDELWPRVQDAAAQTAITDLLGRNLHTLSGGQLQAVAQASALAAKVPVLLYDEPTSNLSPEAIDKFTEVLRKQKIVGKTLIIAEHRLYFLRGLVDNVVYFQLDGPPQLFSGEDFFALSDEQRRSLGLRTLEPPRIPDLVTGEFNTSGQSTALKAPSAPEAEAPLTDGLSVCALDYAYPGHPVLADVNVDFPAGEITAITGANGAGKTTLARLLCGLAKPKAGQIYLDGQAQSVAKLTASTAIVMQDVHRQLFAQSVTEEVLLGSADEIDLETLLSELDLARFAQRHPLSLSGGQKQRLVIAAALATKQRVFIFDEPTFGVDYQQLCAISQLFRKLADSGHIVLVITHDGELIKSCADNVWKLNPLSHTAPQVSATKDVKMNENENTHQNKGKAGQLAFKKLMQPISGRLAIARVLAVCSAVLSVGPFIALVKLADVLFPAWQAGTTPDTQQVNDALYLLIGLFLTQLFCYTVALGITHFADTRLRAHIQRTITQRIAQAPLSWFSKTSSGQVRKAVQDDSTDIHMVVAHAPVDNIMAIISPLFLLVYAFYLNWILGFIAIATLPFYAGAMAYMMRDMGEKTAEMDTRLGEVSATMVEFVTGISVVKAFGQTGKAHARFQRVTKEFHRFYLAWCGPMLRMSALAYASISTSVLLLANLGLGALVVHYGYGQATDLIPTTIIAMVIPHSIEVLGNSTWAYQIAGAAALRIEKIINVEHIDTEGEGCSALPSRDVPPEIVFNQVSFSYDKTKAVDNVSLTLKPGSVTALIGPSGGGKSTLATLVARFSDPDSGSISIGGIDLKNWPTEKLYDYVSFVLQDPHILRLSIRDNVALGRPEADDESIWQALRDAQIADEIAALPRGLDTVYGVDTHLSGGQCQRLSIARALLIDASILILDEATAFADPESEALIQAALTRLVHARKGGRTVLAIAHRPASISGVDQIVIMENGRISAQGTPAEVSSHPLYQSLREGMSA